MPSPTEFTIGYNEASKVVVDMVMAMVKNAEKNCLNCCRYILDGYAGYFQDPDQHLWEVVWNPEFEING